MTSDTLTDPRRIMRADCELALDPEPECVECEDTGEILGAPSAAGRPVLLCPNPHCDARDRQLAALDDNYNASREDD